MPLLKLFICKSFSGAIDSPLLRRCIYAVLLLFLALPGFSQNTSIYKPRLTRILFVLDGSGSMKEKWGNRTKFDIAHKLLVATVDSIQKANPDVEVGIRIFGNRFPRSAKNCKDSNLEVPFSKMNSREINTILAGVTPQGWTPIAYSIYLAAQDFQKDSTVKNAIILITDGLETCDGDLCAAGAMLKDKRITLKPFIIGMGLTEKEGNTFDCVGTYMDASTEEGFKEVLRTTISQSLNTTTAQINLLDDNQKPTETNVPISIYDSYSGALMYYFVHAINDANVPDTLRLDPVGEYDIIVHTVPPVSKKDVRLEPGVHNVIPIPAAQGTLKITEGTGLKISYLQCLVYALNTTKTLNLQAVNTSIKYLTGTYDLEVLTLPRLKFKGVQIEQGRPKDINVPIAGTLNLLFGKPGLGGVYRIVNGSMELVYEFGKMTARETLEMLPGRYVFVYRLESSTTASETEQVNFDITSGATTTLKF